MILFENSILTLDYDPASDILDVAYPDLHDFMLSEIKHNIDILVDNVKHYDVKRLLLDSSRTVISVREEEGREISIYLATGLQTSRVEKVARLHSLNFTVETRAQGNIQHIQTTLSLPFQLQNFTSKPKAVEWLQHSDQL
ncbi:hypothetical protein ACFSKU_02840 [Pontibacter silvestris]|uniref:Uncharacterized protein n=1 Tax=Pontibacter silvestris TaxID=2305183 RepID=A0ABW4WTP6_9BACT|nr:hypothetical protein [Pontibacter silvestris]MCC9138414.1 hypothetical protein [Pontibacter silvestris]